LTAIAGGRQQNATKPAQFVVNGACGAMNEIPAGSAGRGVPNKSNHLRWQFRIGNTASSMFLWLPDRYSNVFA